jgi:hypothetical protein
MAILTGVDERRTGAKLEPVESPTARTFGESIWRVMSLMLLIALGTVCHSNRLVGVGLHSVELSTSLALVESVNWLLVILFVIAVCTICYNRHQ